MRQGSLSETELNSHVCDLRRCSPVQVCKRITTGQGHGFVSEGGLDPRWLWYIPERGIHHHSKLTRQGPARVRIPQAERGGSTGLPDRSRHVTCGNDEGGEPGSGRTQGRTAVAAARRLIIREAQ